jgi:hypothetical protein
MEEIVEGVAEAATTASGAPPSNRVAVWRVMLSTTTTISGPGIDPGPSLGGKK